MSEILTAPVVVSTPPSLRPLSRREIEARIQVITTEVALAFADAEPETIRYLGCEIEVVPMDTRKFIRIMARHLCMN